MEKLPEISDILLSVMEHYVPTARSIYPGAGNGWIIDKALEFERDWLGFETQKANDRFVALMKEKETMPSSASLDT